MTADYDSWNAALTDRFLQQQPGVPLYLYTDEAVLEEVAGEVGVNTSEAVDSFVGAVTATLHGGEPFRSWAAEARAGVPTGASPRYLALLCFLVFVAVERDTVHFQYYPELNRYLQRIASGAPPGFDRDVPMIFSKFNEWLAAAGQPYGAVTAEPVDHYPNIGWALSQAIVRPADRAYLVRMFAKAGIPAHSKQTASGLRSRVIKEIRTSGGSPNRDRMIELDDNHRPTFEDVLLREFSAWDGSATSAVGPRRIPLRLCFDETMAEWWFLAPRVAGTEGKRWEVGTQTGRVMQFKGVEADPPELWNLLGSGDVGQIEDGPTLCSRAARMRWFTVDSAAGAWAEVQRRDPALRQLLLVPTSVWPATGLVDRLAPRADSPLGHVLVNVPEGLDIEGNELDESIDVAPSRPAFEGGLPLNLATGSYLRGSAGVPDVVGAYDLVVVDGRPVALEGGRAALGSLGLGVGEHEVVADGKRLALRLFDQLVEGVPDLGQGSWAADLEEVPRVRVPCDSGNVWLAGASGELEERPVGPCTWAKALDLPVGEADLTGLVSATWFTPTYVIARSFMGKPWVQPVGDLHGRSDRDQSRRTPDTQAARELVSALMLDYGPAIRKQDKAWKRSLAALMRTANR